MAASLRRAQIPISHGKVRKCSSHPEKNITMSCDTCNDLLVCTKCVATTHKSHAFSELEDMVVKKRVPLTHYIETLEEQLGNLNSVLESLQSLKLKVDKDSKSISECINTRVEEVKEQLNKFAIGIADDYKSKIKQNIVLIKTREDYVRSLMLEITNVITRYQTALDSQSVWGIIDIQLDDSFVDKCRSEFAQVPRISKYAFTVFDEGSPHLSHVVGRLTEQQYDDETSPPPLPPRSNVSSKEIKPIPPKTIRKLSLPFGGINSIAIVSQERAWISYLDNETLTPSSTIHQVTWDGDVVSTVEVDSPVFCLVLSSTKTLFVSCKDNYIKSVIPNGKVSVVFQCNGLPTGICETPNGDIAVCLRDKSRLVKYSMKGKVLQSLSSSLDKPTKVSANKKTGEMVIIDASTQRRIVVVDANLKLLWIFGDTEIADTALESSVKFSPNQACYDSNGNVLAVIDKPDGGYAVKIKKKMVLNFKRIGFETPFSISVEKDIWTGFENGDVVIFKDL